jgi:predicted Holliday junction resolvase-like endonuclease
MMDRVQLIKELQQSKFYAECPNGCEFKLSDSIIFDGTKPFPKAAVEYQEALLEQFEDQKRDLEKRKKLATEKAEITTKSVNIGKSLEKIFPTLKEFRWDLPDARFLGDPIDLIIFNGLSKGEVNSINFVEIKTGKSPLNPHQKAIRNALDEEKVSYKVI